MTLTELKQILEATGHPVAYSHFKQAQVAPFIAYLVDADSNFSADNKTYKTIKDVRIELYTNYKDEVVEQKLESLLNDNELHYTSDETFIDSEQLFQKIYEVRLI